MMDIPTLFLISLPEAFTLVLFLRSVLGKRDSTGILRVFLAAVFSGGMFFAVHSILHLSPLLMAVQILLFFIGVMVFLGLKPLEALVGTVITFIAATFLQALAISVLLPLSGERFVGTALRLSIKLAVGWTEIILLLLCTLVLELNRKRMGAIGRAVSAWLQHGKNRFLVFFLFCTLLVSCLNYFIILGNYDILVRSDGDRLLVVINFLVLIGFSAVSVFAFIRTVREMERSRAVERELVENERKLINAQKFEALGRVTGWVAHDFNNLLTPIFGCTALLLIDDRLDDELKGRVHEIQTVARRASSLTKELLAYSRRQAGNFEVLDPAELIGSFTGTLSALAGGKIRLSFRLTETLPLIRGDRIRIEQVLLNLVTNARDAAGGAGHVGIEACTVDGSEVPSEDGREHAGQYLCLSVSDDGCGMTEETLSRIFDPFFTLKDPDRGTGLGLSIVREIVQQHKGFVTVTSTPGSGSTFRVYIPGVRPPVG